ncbi:MAG: hypothetical protein RRZ84_04960 [Romboutsia sp.]
MKKAIITLSILFGGLLIINPINNTTFAEGTKGSQIKINAIESGAEVVEELNKEQAEAVLKIYNPNIEYIFQGDENNFGYLKDNNLEGYVFLGNVEGDLGYFVNKDTAKVYYFHPSGYLEIIL